MVIMTDILFGAGAFFVMLAINKAIIEPLATNVGRKVLDKHLGPTCAFLDNALEKFGLDFNPEEAIREHLDLEDDELTQEEKDLIVEAAFREWDLRKAVHVQPE